MLLFLLRKLNRFDSKWVMCLKSESLFNNNKKKDLPSFVSISSAVPQEKIEMQKKCWWTNDRCQVIANSHMTFSHLIKLTITWFSSSYKGCDTFPVIGLLVNLWYASSNKNSMLYCVLLIFFYKYVKLSCPVYIWNIALVT